MGIIIALIAPSSYHRVKSLIIVPGTYILSAMWMLALNIPSGGSVGRNDWLLGWRKCVDWTWCLLGGGVI